MKHLKSTCKGSITYRVDEKRDLGVRGLGGRGDGGNVMEKLDSLFESHEISKSFGRAKNNNFYNETYKKSTAHLFYTIIMCIFNN